MESKHKNALIGALLAVVFIMAVGYAAFAQQLTINGTAEITTQWDVHFNKNSKTISCVSGMGGNTCGSAEQVGTTNPYGSISYSNTDDAPLVATIDVKLYQPGDSVTFTLNPHNYGTGLNAHGSMTVASSTDSVNGYSGVDVGSADGNGVVMATKGHIRFVVTPTFASSLTPEHEDTITVRAEYTDVVTNESLSNSNIKAGITVTLNYAQAA